MPGPMGNHKGSAFERTICRCLSEWVTEHKRDDVFWRSASSGGLATRRGSRGSGTQTGDVSLIHPDGHGLLSLFVVECKFYRRFEYDLCVYGQNKTFRDIWEKVRGEAMALSRSPFLVCKENNRRPVVWTDRRGGNLLWLGCKNGVGLSSSVELSYIGAKCYLLVDILADVNVAQMVALSKGEGA